MYPFLIKVKNLVISFFILLFIIGTLIYKDYGISWDEQVSRNNGFVNGNYIAKKILPNKFYENFLKNTLKDKFPKKTIDEVPILDERHDKAYGVTFDLPAAALEILLNINENNIFDFRHILAHIFFLFALIFFYKLIKLKTNNVLISLICVLFIYLHPRLFAHSFFNSKDLFFLSVFLISYYSGFKFLKDQRTINIIIFSSISGFLTATKIYGLTIIFLFLFLFLSKKIIEKDFYLKREIKIFFQIIFFWLIFTFIFWPYLWESPINNFIETFKFMSNHIWYGKNLFLGERIPSNNLPLYYVPLWFLITTPIIYVFIFLISIIFFILSLSKRNILKINNFIFFESIILILYLFFPIIFSYLKNSTIYDGWRHFYFLYPLFVLLFANFILEIKNKNLYYSFILIILSNFAFMIYTMVSIHPNQNLYFNNILGSQTIRKFEKDYWAVSNKILINKVLELNKTKDIIYYDFRGSPLKHLSLKYSNKKDKIKFIHIDDVNNFSGEYYMFILSRWGLKLNKYYKTDKDIIFEVKYDGVPVNGVYLNEKK